MIVSHILLLLIVELGSAVGLDDRVSRVTPVQHGILAHPGFRLCL